MDFLPLPEGTSFADAREVSGDGTVVVGKGSGGLIWTPFGVSTLELDVATGISDDGSVVVGNRGPSAMRWVGGNYETAASGSAEGVSLDGKVLVGAVPAPLSHGYYIKAGGTSNAILGTVVAKAANIDGTVIVGGKPAFRWTAATGPQTLPNPAGVEWVAEDVSGDGTVVVGSPDGFTITDTAVIWRVGIGSKLLSTLLRDAGVDVTGWSFSKANGISADGKVVVGYAFHPNGNSFAFRAVLP